MQSENFDNKIRQAAEQHHPEYDGKAWAKMEKLLDRHLPGNDHGRKRIIFFLLFLLVTGGGAWLIVSKPWQQRHTTLSTTNTPGKAEANPSVGSIKEATAPNSVTDKRIEKEVIAIPVITNKEKAIQTIDAVNSSQKKDQNLIVTNRKITANTPKQEKVKAGQSNKSEQLTIDVVNPEIISKDKTFSFNNPIVSPSNSNNNDKQPGNGITKTPVDQTADNNIANDKNDIAKDKANETKSDNTTEQIKTTDKKDIAKKSNSRKPNTFFFSFSAAPDLSSIGLDNPGKIKLLRGAGFGYTFRDRLTIRTGFYSGSKVYSANKEEYKPSVQPFNYTYLDKIDADCKVYEIPVSLSYNFSHSKRHSLFAAAGLSSYIMKKENYVYLYKHPNGSTYSYTKTVNNEYKHYFSVLTLSAGYEHKISRTFSVSAEPYIKLPLAGVGYGKVKLNSAGVLFSVNISPFQPSAKK